VPWRVLLASSPVAITRENGGRDDSRGRLGDAWLNGEYLHTGDGRWAHYRFLKGGVMRVERDISGGAFMRLLARACS
jgi:hypothetical protein